MRSIIVNATKLWNDYNNYDYWAEILWAGSVAHNDMLGVGRKQSWVSHGLEHELSAIYDIAHGQGLAIIFPAWMKTVYAQNTARFVQFATRVWDVDFACAEQEDIILEGIARTERFFQSLQLPVRLSEINIDHTHFEKMSKAVEQDKRTTYALAMEVYQKAK